MNGVPNSPINRYHQVDGVVIENNTLDGVAAIELAEGSDKERSAFPINTTFANNLVIGSGAETPFNLYDDMSGISHSARITPISRRRLRSHPGFPFCRTADLRRTRLGHPGPSASANLRPASLGIPRPVPLRHSMAERSSL
jgi:hypothetical protein